MHHQLELAYLVLEVPDPTSLTSVFGDVVGLVPADGETIAWRNDDRAHRIIVEQGDRNDAIAIGFEAVGDAAFDRIVASLAAVGHDVIDGTPAQVAARRVERLVTTTSPWGIAVEVVTGLAAAATPFASDAMPGGFHTSSVGFGHAVFATQDMAASSRFLIDGLGFGQSDWLETELAPGIDLEVHFFHCNERHHTIALALVPFEVPQRLHHIMFETTTRDDVGAAFDRAWATELAIPNGLGKHDNDGMFSFYLQTPAGFQVEVGHGARTVDDDWDDDRRYDTISAWGHQPLRQA